MRFKAIVLIAVAAAIAAAGAGWRWHHHGPATGSYHIAGWTWGDDAARGDDF